MRFIYDNRQNPLKLVGSHPRLLNIDPFYHIRTSRSIWARARIGGGDATDTVTDREIAISLVHARDIIGFRVQSTFLPPLLLTAT